MHPTSRHLAVVTILSILGTLGCHGGAADVPPLYVLTKAGPTSRDPLATFDESSAAVFVNVFDPLVRYPPVPDVRGGVLASWVNPDTVTWELVVRQGLRFHDGSAVRPADVAATLRRVMADTSSPLHPFVKSVVVAEVEEPGRVRVVTAGPVNLLSLLTFIPVVPEAGPLDSRGLPNGSGPYRVTHWSEDRIELQRTDPVHGTEAGKGRVPRRVVISVIPEEKREEELARTLRPLIVLNPSPALVENAGALGLERFSADALAAAYLVCNLREGRPTARLEVRRALAASIDRRELADALRGEQAPATDLVPPGVLGWKAGRFRPDSSWKIADGVPAEPLEFLVIESMRPVAEEVARQLEEAGFGVHVVPRGVDDALAAMGRGDFDISLIGYSCPTGTALEFFGFAFSGREDSGSGWNFSGYRNPRFETILQETATTIDPAIQNDLLLEAGDVVLEDLPWIPLFSVRRTMLASRDVKVAPSRSGVVEFDRARILR